MKQRSDSIWAGLAPEQREILEAWLFDENLSYRETLERAQKEFGVAGSITSLSGFYARTARERRLNSLVEANKDLRKIIAAKMDNVEAAAVKLVNFAAYELALAGPEKMKPEKLSCLMNTLMMHRRQRVLEERQVLAQKKYELQGQMTAIKACREHANMPQKLSQEKLKEYIQFVKEEFYGEKITEGKIEDPENDE